MIIIQDLRIGNWVYDGDKTHFPMYIRTIGEDYVYLDFEGNEGDVWKSTPEDLQGIPLNEKLMKDNGFNFNGVWWSVWWRKHEERYVVDVSVGLACAQIEKWANGRIHSRCTCHGVRFVHELQNIFWNIAKQQLNIEL